MKKFIITIDTEGDDLWNWKYGKNITTENVKYLPRFQQLAEAYGFKPVWLSNYEMISDNNYIKFVCDIESRQSGELGMHLHAWNNPPYYKLNQIRDSQPYLIEYPFEVMEEKISFLTNLIVQKTGIHPVSHRAGRWAMDNRYFDLLAKYNYKVDCSCTPHVNWEKSLGCTETGIGSNYTNSSEKPMQIITNNNRKVLEVPMTIRLKHDFLLPSNFRLRTLASSVYHMIFGKASWLRPNGHNLNDMLRLASEESNNDYIMFMIHSSELMPGGSPNFKTIESIDSLYNDIEKLFSFVAQNYDGCTLREYSQMKGL